MIRPFFSFYGAKWRAAPRYPKPKHGQIIEPFAGSAGYSLRYHDLNVLLIEKDPVIAALWAFLIGSSANDIASLPLLAEGETVADLNVCGEAKALIGFWVNKGASAPNNKQSAWMQMERFKSQFWGEQVRSRIARQVGAISHWRVMHGDYSTAPDVKATWFIDPPYEAAGVHYKHSSKAIDFADLATFCKSRRGQVMVCENTGADWLPFQHFMDAKSMEGGGGKSKSAEAIWTNH